MKREQVGNNWPLKTNWNWSIDPTHEDCWNANIGIDIGVIWIDSPIRLNKVSRVKKWRSSYKLVLWRHFSVVLFVSRINNVICKISFCPQSFICSLKVFKSPEWGTNITPYIPILKWNTMTSDQKPNNGCLQHLTCCWWEWKHFQSECIEFMLTITFI